MDHSDGDRRVKIVHDLIPPEWDKVPLSLAHELREFLKSIVDEGTNIDSGGGDGVTLLGRGGGLNRAFNRCCWHGRGGFLRLVEHVEGESGDGCQQNKAGQHKGAALAAVFVDGRLEFRRDRGRPSSITSSKPS